MTSLRIAIACLAAIVLIGYGVPPILTGVILGVACGAPLAWRAGRRRQRAVTLRRLR